MSIRAKIFCVFVASIVSGFGLLAYWVTGELRFRYGESSEEVMVDTSRLLAQQLAAGWQQPEELRFAALDTALRQLAAETFRAPIYSVVKTRADIRVYVTDVTGKLLFDSRPGSRRGEDYSGWLDVSTTLRGRYGARTTEEIVPDENGRPVRVSVAYVAAPIRVEGDFVGIVSLGKPNTNIERFIESARAKLFTAVLLACGIAIVLGLLLVTWVSRPLQSLVDYANDLTEGRATNLPALDDNEIGRVGEAIEKMRNALIDKEYVETYVQSLTHEVKSPLTAIRASAELLAGDLPPERRQQFVDTIEREVDRLASLADRLLELSSLERARRLTHIETVALHAMASEVARSARAVAESRGLLFAEHYAGRDTVKGDPLLLRQAFDNLLRNALDFAPSGSTVVLTATAEDRGVVLAVEDEGPGIPEYARARIFDRFYSLPRPVSGAKSTGLGLNFVHEVAHLHGGSIEVDSSEQGTRARLFIPWRPPL